MSELARRWAVAVIAIPVILGLLYLGGWFLALPLAGFAAWGAHESYRLATRSEVEPFGALGAATAAGLVLLAGRYTAFGAFAPPALSLIGISTLVGLVSALVVRGPDRRPLAATAVTIFGAVYVGLALAFVPLLHALPLGRGWASEDDALAGLAIVCLPLACTWVGDATAFFAGTAWGRDGKKLAPSISPKKSWVGFWAGLGGASIAAAVWLFVTEPLIPALDAGGPGHLALAGGILGVAAVVGDLVESLLKREAGVKDSGTLFPGHGGALDRVDSIVFTMPTAYVLLVLLGRGG